MLKFWNKLLNTSCVVVGIDHHTVYPIFRVGSSSLIEAANKKYIDKQITECQHIDILIRDPGDRFISGLGEYCRRHNLDIQSTWRLVKEGGLIDRHFAPQLVWVFHLFKFYKGLITLRPFDSIKMFTSVHKNKVKEFDKRVEVSPIEEFVKMDQPLMQNLNRTINISELIKENNHALS